MCQVKHTPTDTHTITELPTHRNPSLEASSLQRQSSRGLSQGQMFSESLTLWFPFNPWRCTTLIYIQINAESEEGGEEKYKENNILVLSNY